MNLKSLAAVVRESAEGFEYELFLLRRKTTKIAAESGEFEKITTAEDYGLAVRLKKGARVGFAYTTEVEPAAVRKLVEELKEITALLPPDENQTFQTQKAESGVPSPFDAEAVNKPLEEKVDFVLNFERELMKKHPFVKGTRETTFSEVVYGVEFLNSYGVEFAYDGTAFSLITSLLVESPKGDRNVSWGYRAARYLKDLDLAAFGGELVYKAVETLDPEPFQTRTLPVIFHREAMASLLEVFSELFSGENALKGKTPLANRKGEKVASELFTLVDDGTLGRGYSTHPYDDEGTPQQRKVLVEAGVFKGFLHSLYTARAMNETPTGNGLRSSFTSPPSVGITNLYLRAGEVSFEELLNSAGEVLVVFDLMGLHTADPVSGDFSLGASGVLYRNGKKVQAVRGVTVAGNFLEIIRNISAVGKDLTFYGSVGSPSVLVENITIGGI
jgi:PmbA protein